ncbi:hypothetical protein BD309DRAFT_1064681, partial [Dichomitus squalens]
GHRGSPSSLLSFILLIPVETPLFVTPSGGRLSQFSSTGSHDVDTEVGLSVGSPYTSAVDPRFMFILLSKFACQSSLTSLAEKSCPSQISPAHILVFR